MLRSNFSATVAAALLCTSSLVLAQTAPSPSPSAAAPAPAASPPAAPPSRPVETTAPAPDHVVARVGGEEIHQSDLSAAAGSLPEDMRNMPAPVLYPMLLDQMIDRKIIVLAARKAGLDKDPLVERQIARATDNVLQNTLLSRDIAPTLTDAAIRARYEKDIAGKAGEEEVHAAHILVPTEVEAKQIIEELKKGADFATMAKQHSKDPGAQQGGDLGWFKRADMLPEFSESVFALKPGEITQTPVKTRFGWHVIKLEDTRVAPPPPFEQVRDEVRQQLIQDGVRQVLEQARVGVPVERFNADGTPQPAPDESQPPAPARVQPAPAAPAPQH